MLSLLACPRRERDRGQRSVGLCLFAAALGLLPALSWAVADPQIASLVDDDPVVAGATYNYTVRVANNGTLDALNTRLRLAVPSGASFVSASPAAANCVATSATQIDCNLGTVRAAGVDEREVVFTWRATVAGLATVNATASLTADNDANLANNSDTAATTVTRGSNLALALAANSNPVVGGAPVNYTLNVSHTGPNATNGLVVTQTLSPSSSFVSASGSGWSCSHASGTVTCVHPGPFAVNPVTAVGDPVPAINVVATATAASGTITSSASVAHGVGGPADPVGDNNTAVASTSITPGADLAIADMAFQGAGLAVPGQTATLLVLPRNLGPATGSNVSVVTTLPAGWTVTGASGPGWTCTVATLSATCTRTSMAVGSSNDITVLATAPAVTTSTNYTATAQISSASTADPVSANNSRNAGVTVRPDGADLALRKAKSPNPVALGATLTSEIRVGNFGPRVATGPLRVVDLLNGETFTGFSGSGWSCTASGAVVTCDHPNSGGLGLGDQLPNLSITTNATVAGTLSNTACTGGSVPAGAGAATARAPVEGDPNASNDCETASSVSTTVRPDLAISKVTSTPTGGDKVVAASEGSVTYTLQVSNVSGTAEAATGVRISDTVPGFINGRSSINLPVATVSAGSAVFSCSVSGATVSCNQTAGQLLPGQTVTVPITVNRPLLDGSFTNTATVGNVNEGDPVAANNSASDTVTIAPIADVAVQSKTITPAAGVRAGENATYVISYINNGPSTAANVALTDSFTIPVGDAGLTVVSIASSAAGSTCGIAAGAQLTAAASSFSCTIGSLANGQVESITLVVRPNYQVGNGARSFGNTAAITTTTAESPSGGDNGNNSQTATLLVAPAVIDLLVNTTDVVDPVPFSTGATFLNHRVRVTSGGPSYGTNVRFTQAMTPPAGKRVRFVCDTTTAGGSTCNPTPLCTGAGSTSAPGTALPTFSCQLPAGDASTGAGVGELANGQSKEVFLRFEVLDQPAALGDVFNTTSTVSANEPDNFSANDSDGEATTTRQRIDLRVSKAASVTSVALRQPFNWVITVANNGPGASQQTDLTDTLPAGTELTGPVTFTRTLPAGSGSCAVTGLTVTCALGVLEATGVATVTLPVRVTSFPSGGSLSNTATVDNRPETTGAIDLPGNNNTGTAAVTVSRASVSGLVFEDRDRSGGNGGVPQAAAAEPRIAGVTVRLQGTDAFGNVVDLSTSTDSTGQYSFADLSPSDATGYRLTQTQPAGHANSPAAVPSSGADAPSAGGSYSSGGAAGNSGYTGIVLAAGTDAVRYHFPEVRAGSLSGFVYIDANANGSRDAGGDPAIAGATVRLLNASTGALVATATTDATGAYSFSALDPLISYTLEQPLPTSPAALLNGPVNPGLLNAAACASGCTAQANSPAAGTDRIAGISLASGEDGTQFNFGELQQAGISGTVYIDRNRDNAMQPAGTDGRLGGVTLTLYLGNSCTGTPLASTSTDADGNFSFTGQVAGRTYTVCQTQPAGYADGGLTPGANGSSATANAITISNLPAAGSAGHLFAERAASLSGSVYADHSPATPANTDNGVRDAGEAGIAGVTITLTGRDSTGAAVNRSTTSDASGQWRFDDLLPSDASGYTVSEGTIPAAAGSFNDGRDSAGSAGGTAANDRISAIVLPAGAEATGYTFGELPLSPISGTVYLDRNRDNAMQPAGTDGRLGGVTLTLYLGTSCSGTPLASTSTDASGNFSFANTSAGLTYTVCQTQPAGYADGGLTPGANGSSATANAITISNLPAAGSAGHLFAERAASLSGSVYLDANHDGLRAGSDTGLAGVTVTLSGSDATGAPVNRSTSTDASGNYRFDDLLAAGPGGYTLTEQTAQPAAPAGSAPAGTLTLDGRTTVGTVSGSPLGTASTLTSTPSRISAITLAAGAEGLGYNFGEILPVGLSGAVFTDLNNNGQRDAAAGDTGLGGVTLLVTGTDDTGAPVTRSVVTAADGSFAVLDLRPGTYTLTQPTQPAGTSNGLTTPGSAGGTGTPVATPASAISSIVLGTPGQVSAGNLFAEVPANSVVAGRVWLDSNHNGLIDGSETGIAGQTITLSGTDTAGRPVNLSTSTDANGAWRFEALAPGNYSVTQPAQPAGTLNGNTRAGTGGGTATAIATSPSAISGIVLGVNQTAADNLFGEVPAGLVSGRVWADNNNNAVVDAGESGLAGVPLVLTGTDDLGQPVSRNTSSGADGSFAFDNLRPGTYTVTEPSQPAGTVNGSTVAGVLGGNATPVATTPSAVAGIVLPPGGQATGNLFGELANSPDLLVAIGHSPATLTVGHGATWPVTVRNAGNLATSGAYTVEGRLPTGVTLSALPSGNGWTCTGAVGGSSFSCVSSTVLAPGATHPGAITVPTAVGAAAAPLSPVSAWVLVEGGGEIDARRPDAASRGLFASNPGALPVCVASIGHNVCREPAPVQLPGAVSGTVWLDSGASTRQLDSGDRRLGGFVVEVLDTATGSVLATTTTGADGSWRVDGLLPATPMQVRFREPTSGVVLGYPVNGDTGPGSSGVGCASGLPQAGSASSCVGSGASPFLSVVLAPGQTLPQQSLPIVPSGVVYDSVSRSPVAGATVLLAPTGSCPGWNPATGVVGAGLGGYTVVAGSGIAMNTGAEGLYQFILAPGAPASCAFGLTVTPPAAYVAPSVIIPAAATPLVPAASPGSAQAVQPQASAPTGAVGPATLHHLLLSLGSGLASVVNNHLPLDPVGPTGISLSKTGDKAQAEVGDSIRYTITVAFPPGPRPRQTTVVDQLPHGFTYIAGTAQVNGQRIADPAGGLGPRLAFNLGPAPADGRLVLQYRVRVAVGAQQGDGINRARAHSCPMASGCVGPDFRPLAGSLSSNEGQHKVLVRGGVFTTDACVLGKVFVDCNGNHVQDAEELGIPGVRLVLSDGTTLVSDSEGKYSVCGLPARSHVLRADPLTLPRGARLTTSSNRNLADAGSLWLDLKHGELHRADFIEGSCSNTVLEQTKARRAQGEVRAPETEKRGAPPLRFDSKAHGLDALRAPQQGTDGANQAVPQPRATTPVAPAKTTDESNVPTPQLPMNRPPPTGRDTGTAPASAAQGGTHGTR